MKIVNVKWPASIITLYVLTEVICIEVYNICSFNPSLDYKKTILEEIIC